MAGGGKFLQDVEASLDGQASSAAPLLSIVMYFIKPAPFLNEALASIIDQRSDEVELVVVAGHEPSDDIGISADLAGAIDRLIVEPDRGAWDAANKGWRVARGRWVQFCMADDWLPEGSLVRTLAVLRSEPTAALVSGGLSFVEANRGGGLRVLRSAAAQDLTLDRVLDDLCSTASIWRRDLLAELGGFDERFSSAHDRDLMLRAWQRNTPHRRLPHDTYRMRVHNLSRTTSGDPQIKLAYWRDHVTFADDMLRQGDLAEEDQRKLLRWRDEALVKFHLLRQVTSPRPPPLAARISPHRAASALAGLVRRKAAGLLRRAAR